jgi:GNAT superfamily N-acetyltransferase
VAAPVGYDLGMAAEEVLHTLERYYDTVPRASARTEELGPFTLFLRSSPEGWPYYARPRLGDRLRATVEDVEAVRSRQRELEAPEAFEWVAEMAPDLLPVVSEAGLAVHQYPLMVLEQASPAAPPPGIEVVMLTSDDDRLAEVNAVVEAGFEGTDVVGERRPADFTRSLLAAGLLRLVGAFDAVGPVGGGSHAPRGGVTELSGIAVLPRVRGGGLGAALTARLVADAHRGGASTIFLSAQDERVAAVYGRVGFARVGTACTAEAAS